MDEMLAVIPPELESSLNEFYSGPRPEEAFVQALEARLRQAHSATPQRPLRLSRPTAFLQTLRARPALAFLVALLALLALTGFAYALGHLAGFIPGFGFTADRSAVYVLSEPVEMRQSGVTLRLEDAVSDETHLWVALSASGDTDRMQDAAASVLLKGGGTLSFQSGSGNRPVDGEAQFSYTFAPLPAGAQTATLRLETRAGAVFELPLRLRPAEPGEILPAQPPEDDFGQRESLNGVALVLGNVAPAHDQTVFQVSLRYDRPNTWLAGPWNVQLTDENGLAYPLEDITPGTMNSGETRIYKTAPFTGQEHLTLSLVVFPDEGVLPLYEDFSSLQAGFTFDPGSHPQPGQTWELDETVQVGPFTLHAVRAEWTGESGVVFEFAPVKDVTGVMLYTPDPSLSGAAGGVPTHDANFTAGLTFHSAPTAPFQVVVNTVYYQVSGRWQVDWQPPAAPPAASADSATPTARPTLPILPTATLATDNPLLLEVQQLARQFDAPFQQGPGWIRVVSETLTDPHAGQTFPPPYLKSELWYEIDAEGYVTRYVWSDYDEGGQLIQQAATVGDYSVNFTYGYAGYNNGSRYRFSADGLTQDLSSAFQNNGTVLREETTCEDGRACLLITRMETFAAPVQNTGEPQAFTGAGQRTWVDRQSGQQIKTQSFWLLADGSESVSFTRRTLLVEKQGAAPQSILDVLSRVTPP